MYEHRSKPLLPPLQFFFRVLRHALLAGSALLVALGIGILGYHQVGDLTWIDAILNAAMILSGMGPVNALPTTGGKLFAAGYALFSGLMFIGVMGVLLAPFVHRLLHRFHLEAGAAESQEPS